MANSVEIERLKKATLEWCNKQRDRKNMKPLEELPKGKVGDPESCPCGKATNMDVGFTDAVDYSIVPAFKTLLPPDVMGFVHHFDNEEIPELIDSGPSNYDLLN